MFKQLVVFISITFSCILSASENATVQIELSLPELNVNPYHNPYVAVWLESPSRQYVTTIALWADDVEWYKDLRQWWRKAARSEQSFDAVTGATKKPGTYTIFWSGKDASNNTIAPGNYWLKFEVSREEGGREFIKTKVNLDNLNRLTLVGKHEFGNIKINIDPSKE